MSHPLDEVRAAVDAYCALRTAIEAGDATWTDLADLFTDDVVSVSYTHLTLPTILRV